MISEVNGVGKLLSFLLDNLTVPPRPPEREWVPLVPPNSHQSKCKRIYGVLCGIGCHCSNYYYYYYYYYCYFSNIIFFSLSFREDC